MGLQQVAAPGVKRQMGGQAGECRQINEIGTGIAVDRSSLRILSPFQVKIGRRNPNSLLRQ